jgi:hypothetical protein
MNDPIAVLEMGWRWHDASFYGNASVIFEHLTLPRSTSAVTTAFVQNDAPLNRQNVKVFP